MKQKWHRASVAPILFWMLAPFPLAAVIDVNDGASYTINSNQTATDDFELDHQATVGGGTLVITSSGTLTFSTARTIANTLGEGVVSLDGEIIQNANAPSTIAARVIADSGSVLRASQSSLYLTGGGIYEGNLDADGGDIFFAAGSHLLDGATITGSHSIYAYGGIVNTLRNVNPSTGPATGGLVIQGGTITALGALFGGTGKDMISVARATFGNGTINGAKIRITDEGSISTFSDIVLNNGSIINEGIFTHTHASVFDADLLTTSGGGSIVNHGTWRLQGFSDVLNTGGEGEFINHGATIQEGPVGFSIITAKFSNKAGATLQANDGSLIQLMGGGFYESGSEFNAIGDIALRKGTHFLFGITLSGSGALKIDSTDSNVILAGNVGPISGPASGGIKLSGGTITNTGLIGGGFFAAERGQFQSGTIAGVNFRFTGATEKMSGSTTNLAGGSLVIEDTMAQRDGGHFQLDPVESSATFGTIVNKGTWTMEGNSDILSSYGEGEFENHQLLIKSGDGKSSFVDVSMQNQNGATIQVESGALLAFLAGGGYGLGTNFHADGELALGNGNHLVATANLTGSGYLRTLGSGSVININYNIGPLTGPATGGFHLAGGTVNHYGGILGGTGVGMISAERGKLGWGTIDGATLRFTGASQKLNDTEVIIRSGKIVNEGILTQAEEGDFEMDPGEEYGQFGTIENRGTWSVTGSSTIQSFYGEGTFENYGLFQLEENSGISTINANYVTKQTGVVRVRNGAFLSILGTTSHLPGSVLDADGGAISFNVGTHLLYGTEITGANAVRCSADGVYAVARIGPETGPATGGFSIEGGILRGEYAPGLGIVISGPGAGHIAVDHGKLIAGSIEGAHLRYTGQAEKLAFVLPITIADGSLTNEGTFTQAANGNFEIHPITSLEDPGVIHNKGTWQSLGTSQIGSFVGDGLFHNEGLLTHAAGTLTISAPLENDVGGTLSTTGGTIVLSRETTHQSGSVLHANNGNISLQTSTHHFYGGTLSGAAIVEIPSGSVELLGNVGAASGAATGRIMLNGGTITGTAQLSVSDGIFQHGMITGSPTLRLTGASSKSASNILSLNGGMIRNEGTFSMSANAQIDLDVSAGGGAGTIRNEGEWYALSGNFSNTSGAGVFENNGLFRNDSGNFSFYSAIKQLGDGRVRSTAGNVYLTGGGEHYAGSVLDAATAPIYLNGGTHTFYGGGFEGNNWTYCTNGTMMMQGDVGPSSGAAMGNFGIAGGTVTGSGTVSAQRGYFASGTLSGSVVLRFTDQFTKAANTQFNMNGGTLQMDGLYESAGGADFDLDSSNSAGAGTIINNGTWRLNLASNYSNSYGGGVFINNGLFESVSGNSLIYAAFHSNAGSTLRANNNYIRLLGGGVQQVGSTLHTNGGDIYYSGGTHQLLGGTLTGSGFVYATGGLVSVEGNIGATTGAATGGFGISSGTVTGSGMISAERGSFLAGSMGGTVTLRYTGNSTKWSNSSLNMNGGTIRNEGTMSHLASGTFDLDSAAGGGAGTLLNIGTWNQTGGSIISNDSGAGVIDNSGLWHISAGNSVNYAHFIHRANSIFRVTAGQSIFTGGSTMESDATIDVNGGYLYLSTGTHTLQGGTITGNAYVYSSGGTTIVSGHVGASSGAATGGYGIAGGTVTGTAMLSADHGYFSSGSMGGSVTLRLTGASSKGANTTINMNGGTIRNEGTMTHPASGSFDLDSSTSEGAGTILNIGTWNQTGGSTISNDSGSGVIDNFGLWHISAGNSVNYAHFIHRANSIFRVTAGQSIFTGGSTMESDATIDVNGGYLYLSTGTHTLQGGTITGNAYVYSSGGTTIVSGDVGASSGAATGGYGIVGGTLTGTAMLSADHGYFSSGSMGGSVTLRLTGASVKGANSTLNMNGGTIRNEGTMTHPASGSFDLDSSASVGAGTLQNLGTWNQTGGSILSNDSGAGLIDNFGLWHISSGNSVNYAHFIHRPNSIFRVTGGQMIFTGGGTVKAGAVIDADGGTVYFNGGTQTLEGGTITGPNMVYCGIGSTVVSGDVGATSGPATGGFGVYNTGFLTGSAMLSVDHGYLAAGSIGGTVTLRMTGTSQKVADTVLNMSGGTIRNEGTINVAVSGDINLDGGSGAGGGMIVNQGLWKHAGNCNLSNTYLEGTVQNAGTFEITSGTTQLYAHYTNSGITRVVSGSLFLRAGSEHTGGLVSNGSVTFIGSGHSVSGSNAFIGGSGSFSGNVSLTNAASIAPGNSPGTLALYGAVQFLASTEAPSIDMELAAGNQFDQIVLGNGASLSLGTGVTDLVLDLQYQPSPGQTFRLVSAGTSTGNFSGRFRNAPVSGDLVSASFAGQVYQFRVNYDASNKYIDLVYQSGYQLWASQMGLVGNDGDFAADPDGDGVSNGIEFIIGGEPRPGYPDTTPHPNQNNPVIDETHLIFTHRRSHASRYLPTVVQYNQDLSPTWLPAQHGTNGVEIIVNENFYGIGIDQVVTKIPRSLAVGGKIFVRLHSQE